MAASGNPEPNNIVPTIFDYSAIKKNGASRKHWRFNTVKLKMRCEINVETEGTGFFNDYRNQLLSVFTND